MEIDGGIPANSAQDKVPPRDPHGTLVNAVSVGTE
jgi:hypothetical protein